jgi:hypothetical protein
MPQAQPQGSGHFSLDSANSVGPDSVLEEVAYFATGGPDACFEASEPEVQGLPETVEWVQNFALITCGWEEGEEVNVTIISPDGSLFSEKNIAGMQGMDLSPSVMYFITSSAVGQYQFIFEGQNTTLNITLPVYKPLFPRMHV